MMLRPFIAASAVLLIALPARAERPDDAVTLEYLPSRATVALCPAANFLNLEVQIRLGYKLFQPSAPNHLTVKVDRANGLFRSSGEMRDEDGNVTFARTHSEIDCTMAVIDMAIELSIKFTRLPEPPEPSPPLPPPPEPLPTVPAPTLPTPAPVLPAAPPSASLPLPERRRYQAGIAAVFSGGTAPSIVGGVGGGLSVRWPSVSLGLEGRVLFAPSARIEQSPVRNGYHFVFTALSGSGCYHPSWIFVCARAEIGNLFFDNAKVEIGPANMASLGLGLRLGGDWTLTPWLAIRTYVEILGTPLSGHLSTNLEEMPIWNQSGPSRSVGVGPVFTFLNI